jgi:hypothetical protein
MLMTTLRNHNEVIAVSSAFEGLKKVHVDKGTRKVRAGFRRPSYNLSIAAGIDRYIVKTEQYGAADVQMEVRRLQSS